jgi:hypothetical protein
MSHFEKCYNLKMNFNLKYSYEFDFIIIGSWNTTFSLSDSSTYRKVYWNCNNGCTHKAM